MSLDTVTTDTARLDDRDIAEEVLSTEPAVRALRCD